MRLKTFTLTLNKCYMCNSIGRFDYQLQILLIFQLGPLKNVSGSASSPAGGEARAKSHNICMIRTAVKKELADEVVIGKATKVLTQAIGKPDFAGGVSEDSPPKL